MTTRTDVLGRWIDRRLAQEAAMRQADHYRKLAAEHKFCGRLAAWHAASAAACRMERMARQS